METVTGYVKEHPKYTARNWSDFLDHASMRHKCRKEDKPQKSVEEYAKSLKHAMRQYAEAEENCSVLHECLANSKEGDSETFFTEHYLSLDSEHLNAMLSTCTIMIITANQIEKAMLHFEVAQFNKKIYRIINGQNAYFIFRWGAYWVAHVHQGETGANKDMGANSTICDALAHFTPNIIISLGVAFGIDYTTQQIGDVLVSKRIFPYSENKLDEDKLKPDRSQDKTIDSWLHVRLKSAAEFLDSVTYGDILTGGSVLSSFEEKDKICLGYTKADFVIGGEMEGNAVFQTAQRVGIPGVVIKGICDWGVAKNDIFMDMTEEVEPLSKALEEVRKQEEDLKDSLQAFAMKKAIEKCSLLLKDKGLFSSPKNENIEGIKKQNKVAEFAIRVSAISQLIIFMCSLLELSVMDFLKGTPSKIIQIFAIITFFLSLLCISTYVTFFKVNSGLSNKNPEKMVKKILAYSENTELHD